MSLPDRRTIYVSYGDRPPSGFRRSLSRLSLERAGLVVLLVAADIAMLAESAHFPTGTRDLARLVGVGFAALMLFIAALAGLALGLFAAAEDVMHTGIDLPSRTSWRVRLIAAGLALAIGALAGTSVIIYGPSDILVVAGLLLLARRIHRGRSIPHLRRLLTAGALLAAVAASGIGLLLYHLR